MENIDEEDENDEEVDSICLTDRKKWKFPLVRTRAHDSPVPMINFKTGRHRITLEKSNTSKNDNDQSTKCTKSCQNVTSIV